LGQNRIAAASGPNQDERIGQPRLTLLADGKCWANKNGRNDRVRLYNSEL